MLQREKPSMPEKAEPTTRRELLRGAGAILAMPSIAALAGGCTPRTYDSKGMLLDGAVVVEYHQTKSRGQNDYLSFRFYETGDYSVDFSITPGKSARGSENLPKKFSLEVTSCPREWIVEQYVIFDEVVPHACT